MKKTLILFIVLIGVIFSFSEEASKGYVPFVYGEYTQGQRVRLNFDRDKKIDRIDFTWSDESENKNSRVELYVDHLYKGSKNVWGSWQSFWVNKTPRYSVELRISSGKVRIRRAYINYAIRDNVSEYHLFLNFMEKRNIPSDKAIELLNSMSMEEHNIVLSSIIAIYDDVDEEINILKEEYDDLANSSEDCIDIRNILYNDEEMSREYVSGSGHYFNGSTVYLNLKRDKKIRSISVSWRTKDNTTNNFSVRGELYLDGIFKGSKYIRNFSYDTFYLYGKEMRTSARLKIRGGDVYISSINVSYQNY